MTAMRIKATESTLLVVDIQERLFPAILDGAAMAEHTAWLQQVARQVGVPVLLTEQYSKGLGLTLAPLREGVDEAAILEKLHFSAASDGELFQRPGGDRAQFVVCGCETHVCLLQTALEARQAGIQVAVVPQACGSRRLDDKALALQRLAQAGVTLVAPEMVAFEWMRGCEHPAFREVLGLIKSAPA
jgi:nicotinamidase-related amidase